MSEGWCTIESDPGVFTELVSAMGVKRVEVAEVWSLDELAALRPVHGLIFLFKWRHGEKDARPVERTPSAPLFFASQVVNNACATQAILAVLMNAEGIELGAELSSMKAFTADFPPEMKGLAISNSETIRAAHNAFARPDPALEEAKGTEHDDEVYHFISYVPVGGCLYELDGLKEGPINLGPVTETDWLAAAAPAIQERMDRYGASAIRFALMAVVADRAATAAAEVEALEARRAALLGGRMDVDGAAGGAGGTDEEKSELAALEGGIEAAKARQAEAKERQAAWKTENVRRKFNYLPFICARALRRAMRRARRLRLTRFAPPPRSAARQLPESAGGQGEAQAADRRGAGAGGRRRVRLR